MRGQPTHAQPSALLQEEKEGVEVDRLSALEARVARLEAREKRLRASYRRLLKASEETLRGLSAAIREAES